MSGPVNLTEWRNVTQEEYEALVEIAKAAQTVADHPPGFIKDEEWRVLYDALARLDATTTEQEQT